VNDVVGSAIQYGQARYPNEHDYNHQHQYKAKSQSEPRANFQVIHLGVPPCFCYPRTIAEISMPSIKNFEPTAYLWVGMQSQLLQVLSNVKT
jgi:hypothetical protein